MEMSQEDQVNKPKDPSLNKSLDLKEELEKKDIIHRSGLK